ncbi:MAG: DNA replication/repair protein RecF [Hyphomicrobiaceae bacterium]|nr:DNA replication/repair protein RecF [Hyphomicrobiaceae bacterium]
MGLGAKASAAPGADSQPGDRSRHAVERLSLTDFRNYQRLSQDFTPAPVVLTGANGTGKTNLLEAVSMLAAGQGLRRVAYGDLTRAGGAVWSVFARICSARGDMVEIGTGLDPASPGKSARLVRVDRVPQSGTGVLADLVEMVWLTPTMDGLFTGPAGDRRRFLDRLILCFDPSYRTRVGQFERAMRQRNRLLETTSGGDALFTSIETVMAETGVAIAAARAEAVAQLAATIARRCAQRPDSPFPWATMSLEGRLERELAERPAVEVEDVYLGLLAAGRPRDRAAGRTLDGPHRSDLLVGHGPKGMPARVCSTGEQKALLVGLVMAHAELIRQSRDGVTPILLLDEIAAHLDELRRAALFEELKVLGTQAWMTGTDRSQFAALEGHAQFFTTGDSTLRAQPD